MYAKQSNFLQHINRKQSQAEVTRQVIKYYNDAEITKFMMLYNCCPVSQSEIERLFSFCRRFCSDRPLPARETLDNAMILKFNR